MDKKSKLGYAKGSPYRRNPYLDIHTPEGLIDMSNTDMDLLGITPYGEVQYLKAGMRNPYRFNSDVVREIPVSKLGGNPFKQMGGIQDIVNFLFEGDEEEATVTAPSVDELQHQSPNQDLEEAQRAFLEQQEYEAAMQIALEPSVENMRRTTGERGNPYSGGEPMNVNVQGQKTNGDAAFAFNYYQQKGIEPHIAAGIVGNLVQESQLNPYIKGDNGKATGVAQWHSDRFSQLKKWAHSQNRDPYALDTQLDYVIVEAKQRGDMDRLRTAKNSGEAAYLFAKHYEKPKVIDNKRIGYARSLHPY